MKTGSVLSIVFVFSLVLPSASAAQTKEWTVITSAGDTIRSCTIGTVARVVNLICGNSVREIPIDSLRMLFRHRESHFWSGAGYGTLGGTAVGIIVGLASYQKPSGAFAFDLGPGVDALGSGILGAVAGFTIGGIIGMISGGDEIYDLSQATTEDRMKTLREIRRND